MAAGVDAGASHVRVWTSPFAGAILHLQRGVLLAVGGPEDHACEGVCDPREPRTLADSHARRAHADLHRFLHRAFGPRCPINASPPCVHHAVAERYGALLRGRIVLDVGCGDARGSYWRDLAGQVIGLELDDVAFPGGLAVGADGMWPVADASMDVVIGIFVLEHVLDIDEVIAETARALKLGGVAIWATTLAPASVEVRATPGLALGHFRDFCAGTPRDEMPWLVPLATLIARASQHGLSLERLEGSRIEAHSGPIAFSALDLHQPSIAEQAWVVLRRVTNGSS